MASAFNRFGALAVRHSFRTRPQNLVRSASRTSLLHQSSVHRANEPPKEGSEPAAEAKSKSPVPKTKSSAIDSKDEIIDYGEVAAAPVGRDSFTGFPNTMSQGERTRIRKEMEEYLKNPPEEERANVEQWRKEVAQLQQRLVREFEEFERREPEEPYIKPKVGVLSDGETHPDLVFDDPVDEGDEITTMAHADLEQHREIREYTRLAAWEMPLLSKYARPYEPPGKDQPLRFRHTSYMGETHPAENKVVLEFCTGDLPLTPAQRLKLIKLVGVRYDPRKDLVKMSCESYPNPAQNKRYLGDLVDTLIKEAKNESSAEGGKDKFEDIAPDFRHVKHKKRLVFPSAWKITAERQALLEKERQESAAIELERVESGRLVSGIDHITASFKQQPRVAQATVEKIRAGARLTR